MAKNNKEQLPDVPETMEDYMLQQLKKTVILKDGSTLRDPHDGHELTAEEAIAHNMINSAEETPNEGEKVEIQIITTDNYYYYEATFKTNVPTGEQAFFWDGGFCKVSNNVMWRKLEECEK